MNREQWLNECIQKLRPEFEQLAHPLPEKIRASCSWPSKSGLANKKRRIGEAWSSKNSADQSCEVFISPVLKDPIEVAATLVHELVHCAVGVEAGTQGQVPETGQGHRPGRENDGDARGRGVDGAPATANGRHRPVSARRVDPLQRAEETEVAAC